MYNEAGSLAEDIRDPVHAGQAAAGYKELSAEDAQS